MAIPLLISNTLDIEPKSFLYGTRFSYEVSLIFSRFITTFALVASFIVFGVMFAYAEKKKRETDKYLESQRQPLLGLPVGTLFSRLMHSGEHNQHKYGESTA
jgi:putative Ca2+/H+ antiporter (TMEM165/GDT1 family)